MEEVNVTTQNIEETAPAESMADYAGEIDSSMREISVEDILEGTVVGLTDTEVTVDLQYAAEGIIRTQDYSGDPSFSVKENVHPGDVVKATVLKLDDGNGNILLSRKAAEEELAWDNFKTLMDEKTAVDVTVKEAVKGGVVAFLNGVRAFIPASKLALEYVEDLSTFVGETVPVYVIQAEKEGKRLVLSSRDVLRDRRAAEKANMISNRRIPADIRRIRRSRQRHRRSCTYLPDHEHKETEASEGNALRRGQGQSQSDRHQGRQDLPVYEGMRGDFRSSETR